MRLHSLTLQNFRSYGDATLEVGPGVTLLSGPNAAGKTTIADAVSVALTGTCRGAETGIGLDALRRSGSTRRWRVALTAGDVEYAREEGEGPRSAAQRAVDARLGIPRHQVRAAIYSAELIDGDDKTVQQLLLELSSPGFVLDEDLATLCRAHGVTVAEDRRLSLAELDTAYKHVYERRADAKRKARETVAAEPEVPDGLTAEVAALSNEQLDEQVNGLRQQVGQLRGQAEEKQRRLTALSAQRDALRSAIGTLEAALAQEPVPAADLSALEERVVAARKAHADAQALVRKEEESVKAGKTWVDKAREEYTALRAVTEQPTCPTCRQKIDKATLKRLLDEIAKRGEQVKAQHQVALDALDAARKALGALDHPSVVEAELDDARKAEAAAANRPRLAEELEQARTALARIGSGDDETLAVDIATLQQRVEHGGQLLARLDRYVGGRHAAERIRAERLKAEQVVAELERLCAELGPDGIRAQQAGGADDLAAAINATLAPLGYALDVGPVLAGSGPLLVNGRPARLLSSSEKLRAGLAIQAAVARHTGLGVVFIDDYERLVGDAARRTQEAIQALAAGLQVIVLAASRDLAALRAQAPALAEQLGWMVLEVVPGDGGSGVVRLAAPAEREAA